MPHTTDDAPIQFRMVMASEHLQLDRIVEEAEAFVGAHESDEEFVYNYVMLATEAFTNAIEHGNNLDPDKKVTIQFEAHPETLEIWVEDEGEGFNPDAVADPLAEENLLADSGRGLYLIEALADEVRYEEDGRRVRIIFRRPG